MSPAMRHQAQTHAGLVTSSLHQSSSSLSSSAASSAASSALLAAPSSSSHSDIARTDLSTDARLIKKRPPPISVFPVRSSSLASLMGQSQSGSNSASSPVTSSPLTSRAITNVAATGHRLKRALAARRKKSEDIIPVPLPSQHYNERGNEREDVAATAVASSRTALSARQFTSHLHVLGGKKPVKTPSSPLPPPPPPKPAAFQMATKPPPPPSKNHVPPSQRGSVIPLSPTISCAVNYMRRTEEESGLDGTAVLENEKECEENDREAKNDWRKSDATVTTKPAGHRNSRPVSMADSLQSTNTIVPARRLSALVADAELTMPKEANFFESQQEVVLPPTPFPNNSPPPLPSKARNRRSLSLNMGQHGLAENSPLSTSPPFPEVKYTPASMSMSESATRSLAMTRETPALARTAANAIITPANSGNQSNAINFRDRLAAWTAASNAASVSRRAQAPPEPPARHDRLLPRLHPAQPPRQTAVSFTGSLAPAAGLAKRAVEKMGRAWGGFTSSNSSGYSSSSTVSSPSSYSSGNTSDYALRRSSSRHSTAPPEKPPRKTPNAPSGAWSVTSSVVSSSTADLDAYLTPDGPRLGKQLRGPLRLTNAGAGVAGGIVFGRDLKMCTKLTAVYAGKRDQPVAGQPYRKGSSPNKEEYLRALETRELPAIVVRCAQHLLLWGVQEEGLFRVSGRPFHVSKLRGEFDTGSDYDMSECSPGELDPHAVASIFKAYLRELPEPILTHALIPYFDAAMTAESYSADGQKGSLLGRGLKGGNSLPSGPRNGLAVLGKPPSLSTLAIPNFSNIKPPSQSLLNTLRSLISRLPRENRDLVRTVTELIKETAKQSKVTKMPLSNLFLVFCPSLNMNPPLLRALCEGEGIWDNATVSNESPVDLVRVEPLLHVTVPRPARNGTTDVHDAAETAQQVLPDKTDATDKSPKESQSLEERPTLRSRTLGRRGSVPTIYLDSERCCSSPVVFGATAEADTASITDNASYISASEAPSKTSSPTSADESHPDVPPPLSSSAESLATPSSASFSHLLIATDVYSKPQTTSPRGSPVIAESTLLPLSPRRLVISSPVSPPIQFPSTGPIPPPPTPPLRRPSSIPHLSLPSLTIQTSEPSPSSPSSPSLARIRRLKKPSLHLLLPKPATSSPSATSLISFSPYLKNRPLSDSPTSTPTSAVTAKSNNSSPNLPPVLDTPIDSSSLDLNMAVDNESKQDNRDIKIKLSIPTPTLSGSSTPALSPISTSHTGGQTPIADLYLTPSTSLQSLIFPLDAPPTQPLRPRRSDASLDSTTSNHLGTSLDEDDSDWTRSVLLAADWDGWLLHGAETRSDTVRTR